MLEGLFVELAQTDAMHIDRALMSGPAWRWLSVEARMMALGDPHKLLVGGVSDHSALSLMVSSRSRVARAGRKGMSQKPTPLGVLRPPRYAEELSLLQAAARLREIARPAAMWEQHKVLLHEATRLTQEAFVCEESAEGARAVLVLGCSLVPFSGRMQCSLRSLSSLVAGGSQVVALRGGAAPASESAGVRRRTRDGEARRLRGRAAERCPRRSGEVAEPRGVSPAIAGRGDACLAH